MLESTGSAIILFAVPAAILAGWILATALRRSRTSSSPTPDPVEDEWWQSIR